MSFICQACGKNQATIHITENPYDKAHKKEIHLCDDCAKEKGGGQHPVTLPVMLESLLASQEGKEAGQAAELACPNCGMTFSEFRSGGRLGCPEDYTAFKKALMPFLEKIH